MVSQPGATLLRRLPLALIFRAVGAATPEVYCHKNKPFSLTSKYTSLDTPFSAFTGRHLPAAREYSHLFGLSRVRFAPSFSLVSAGHRRLMKGGRQ
jgi:hypothetical protein